MQLTQFNFQQVWKTKTEKLPNKGSKEYNKSIKMKLKHSI